MRAVRTDDRKDGGGGRDNERNAAEQPDPPRMRRRLRVLQHRPRHHVPEVGVEPTCPHGPARLRRLHIPILLLGPAPPSLGEPTVISTYVPPAISRRECMAVGTKQSQIFKAVIASIAVLVIEFQRDGMTVPRAATTCGALGIEDVLLDESKSQPARFARRAIDQVLRKRSTAAAEPHALVPCRLAEVARIDVVQRDHLRQSTPRTGARRPSQQRHGLRPGGSRRHSFAENSFGRSGPISSHEVARVETQLSDYAADGVVVPADRT
jgi:hypothetical protein